MSQSIDPNTLSLAAVTIVQKIIKSIPPIFSERLKTNDFHCVFNNALVIRESSGKCRVTPCITYDYKDIFIGPKEPYKNNLALTRLLNDLFSNLFDNEVPENSIYVFVLGNRTAYAILKKGMTASDISTVKMHVMNNIRLRLNMAMSDKEPLVQAENARIILDSYGLESVMETLNIKERRNW